MAAPAKRDAGRLVARYGSELLVVFVGVWLSLLAEDWRQTREDASTELASMARMAEDLGADIEDLRFNLERARVGVAAGRILTDPARRTALPTDSLPRLLSALQFCSMFIENPAEYVALRNSGRLGIITDAYLRRRIVSSYEARIFMHTLHADDCTRTEAVTALMASHVRLTEPPDVTALLEHGTDGFPDSSRPRVASIVDPEALFGDVEFINSLTTLVSRRRFLASRIEATIADAEEIQIELLRRVDTRKPR